jgi:hypothetical protein
VTTGHVSFDLRRPQPGHRVELDTPNAAFTMETAGYYRADITEDTTAFVTRRGGSATMTSGGGETWAITPMEEVVIQGSGKPSVETYVAPERDAWDLWNYVRMDHLMEVVSERYVSPEVYGTDDLDHYGTWRIVPEYGPVWIPQGLPPDWAPYSQGSWIWDPYYEWTWVDQAPWGWAPYHYGRWVFVDGLWAWAPGPLLVPPEYAPALVAFFGGSDFGIGIGIDAPAVGWVALDWGEPLVPWWGPAGFIGVPWWGGWGGPRVVEHAHVPRHLHVRHAVTAVRNDRFGRGPGEFIRVPDIDPHQLEFTQGKVPVQPVAASLSPGGGHAARPPQAAWQRAVVGTHVPHDYSVSLRSAGLAVPPQRGPEPRIVAAPSVPHAPFVAPRPPFGQQGTMERKPPPAPPPYSGSPKSPSVPRYPVNLPGQPSPQSPSVPRHPVNLPGQPANRLYSGGAGAVPPAGNVRGASGRR